MSSEQQKKEAAYAALSYIKNDSILGVGTGSTVNYFIDALAEKKIPLLGAVASSVATEQRLRALNIPLLILNELDEVPLYIDGADEVNHYKQMIKGGGGALMREKIIATAAKRFVCIVHAAKQVTRLGDFPLAVEVIPMARSFVARQLVKLGGQPVCREHFVTDNGNVILDVHHLVINEPVKLEMTLNDIPGVVGHGLFALRCADDVLIGGQKA